MQPALSTSRSRKQFVNRMWAKHQRRVEQIPKSMVHCLDELDLGQAL